MGNELHENPVTDGQPVEGVCEGRIVAYWPTKNETEMGLRAVGGGGYIPAMIVANWGQKGVPNVMPCCNLRLFTDLVNVPEQFRNFAASSCRYSAEPAYGCWTWIPKA